MRKSEERVLDAILSSVLSHLGYSELCMRKTLMKLQRTEEKERRRQLTRIVTHRGLGLLRTAVEPDMKAIGVAVLPAGSTACLGSARKFQYYAVEQDGERLQTQILLP
jgi:hypothetical protein